VPPAVAKWIIKDAVVDGVAPDKVADVVKEAIKIESEDQEAGKRQRTEKGAGLESFPDSCQDPPTDGGQHEARPAGSFYRLAPLTINAIC
jgi:hypothetical protein